MQANEYLQLNVDQAFRWLRLLQNHRQGRLHQFDPKAMRKGPNR
jgi:hypothetical protein